MRHPAAALGLAALALLAAPAARAQSGNPATDPSLWNVTDVNGNILHPDTGNTLGMSGYTMSGTMSGTTTNTYPSDYPLSAGNLGYPFQPAPNWQIAPNVAWQFSNINSGSLTNVPAVWYMIGQGVIANSSASNRNINQYLWDNALINGQVTTQMSGTLAAYFRYRGQGQANAPAAPDHIDILLTDALQVGDNVWNVGGASASETASEGEPFKGQISVSNTAGFPIVPGQTQMYRHLVRASVNNNGVAAVSLSPAVSATATDNIPWGQKGANGYWQQTNGNTWVDARASVWADAQLDSREISIGSGS